MGLSKERGDDLLFHDFKHHSLRKRKELIFRNETILVELDLSHDHVTLLGGRGRVSA